MAVEAGLDTGGIYAELATEIGEEETADELRARLVAMGCRLLVDCLGRRAQAACPMPRDQEGEPSYAEKILPGELELRWDQEAIQIRRVVRLGRAWTTFRGRRLHVLAAAGAPARPDGGAPAPPDGGAPAPPDGGAPAPGSLDGAEVVAGGGTRVRLVTVQPEGKRPMDVDDWLRGVRPRPGERLGT